MLKFTDFTVGNDIYDESFVIGNYGVVVGVIRRYEGDENYLYIYAFEPGQYRVRDNDVPFECGTMEEVTRAALSKWDAGNIAQLEKEAMAGLGVMVENSMQSTAQAIGCPMSKYRNVAYGVPMPARKGGTSPAELHFSGETGRRILAKVEKEFSL